MHETFFLVRFDFSFNHLYKHHFFVYQNSNCNYLTGAFYARIKQLQFYLYTIQLRLLFYQHLNCTFLQCALF